jgi:hypothetical protein
LRILVYEYCKSGNWNLLSILLVLGYRNLVKEQGFALP